MQGGNEMREIHDGFQEESRKQAERFSNGSGQAMENGITAPALCGPGTAPLGVRNDQPGAAGQSTVVLPGRTSVDPARVTHFQGNDRPESSSNASMYLARVLRATSSGSAGGGLFLSQPVVSSQSRTNCLS